jgi:hypothetical protein
MIPAQPEHPTITGPLTITTTLTHFAIITYRVDVAAVIATISHPRFVPTQVGGTALASAVHFVDEDFRFRHLPWPRWWFAQTNYRIYVTDAATGEPGVWFLGTALDSPWVSLPRHAWSMPWHLTRHDLTTSASRWHYACTGWGAATAELIPDVGPVTALDDLPDLTAAHALLTHPHRGWFRRRDGRLGSYAIAHPAMDWRLGAAIAVNHPRFARSGIPTQGLHSVLTTAAIPFTISLPPRLIPD